ncbi:MAG TPA: hypothetical protein GX521_08155, partial [Firmicutes bacterium]|nr:hypothetical protein [Bacillota bacterium]
EPAAEEESGLEFVAGPYRVGGPDGQVKDISILASELFLTNPYTESAPPTILFLLADGSLEWLQVNVYDAADWGWGIDLDDHFYSWGPLPFLPPLASLWLEMGDDDQYSVLGRGKDGVVSNIIEFFNYIYLVDGRLVCELEPSWGESCAVSGVLELKYDGSLSFAVNRIDAFGEPCDFLESWSGTYTLPFDETGGNLPDTLLLHLKLDWSNYEESDEPFDEIRGVFGIEAKRPWEFHLQRVAGDPPYRFKAGDFIFAFETLAISGDDWGSGEDIVDYLDYGNLQDIKDFLAEFDVDLRSESEQTALMVALIGRAGLEIIEELVHAGADVNARDWADNIPLIWAAWAEAEPAVLRLLLAEGAGVDAQDDIGATPLMWALYQRGGRDTISPLLEAGADANLADYDGDTALAWAVRAGADWEIIKLLLAQGGDISALNDYGQNLLHIAAAAPEVSLKTAAKLLELGVEINGRDHSNRTPLADILRAAEEPALVELLIRAGADVNAADDWGNTPLIWATRAGQSPAVIKMLVAAGAEINHVDGEAYSPLMWALVNEPQLETVKILLEGGADLNLLDYTAPLVLALEHECGPQIVTALIEAGADVNQETEDVSYPFLKAILYDYGFDAFRAFLEAGADVNVKDYGGSTSLMYAAINLTPDSPKIVAELIQRGVSVHDRDFGGSTPLLFAAGADPNSEVFRLLINGGADINAREISGRTALMLAAGSNTNPAVIRVLLAAGADGSLKSEEGKTAFDYAAANESLVNTEEYWLLGEARF